MGMIKWILSLFKRKEVDLGLVHQLNQKGIGVYF